MWFFINLAFRSIILGYRVAYHIGLLKKEEDPWPKKRKGKVNNVS
jgi:hypothetical protein